MDVMERDTRTGLYLPDRHRAQYLDAMQKGARERADEVIEDKALTPKDRRKLLRGVMDFLTPVQRHVVAPPMSGGMSFITGTSCEVMYSSIAPGTNLNTFTTEDNLQKTMPYVIIPAGFFFGPQGATGKALRVVARGRLGTTGAPTFAWTLRLLTSSTWSAAGLSMATAALTAGTTQTLAPWVLNIDIIFRTLGTGAASTLAILGEVISPLGLASPFAGTMPGNNTAFTVTTFDNSVTNYLFLSSTGGTSSGSNLITLEMLKVYGEN